MKQGEVLVNPSVVKELTKDGSRITDWQKMSTPSIELPTGQRAQVHFYQNRFTGEINYTHSDFKVKNLVDTFYEPNAPKITTPQSLLSKYRN